MVTASSKPKTWPWWHVGGQTGGGLRAYVHVRRPKGRKGQEYMSIKLEPKQPSWHTYSALMSPGQMSITFSRTYKRKARARGRR